MVEGPSEKNTEELDKKIPEQPGVVREVAQANIPNPEMLKKAEEASREQFPDPADKHYQKLARKEYLQINGSGVPLTNVEAAELGAKRQFPDPEDGHYRQLAAKEILQMRHDGPPLNKQELNELMSARQERHIAEQQQMNIPLFIPGFPNPGFRPNPFIPPFPPSYPPGYESHPPDSTQKDGVPKPEKKDT